MDHQNPFTYIEVKNFKQFDLENDKLQKSILKTVNNLNLGYSICLVMKFVRPQLIEVLQRCSRESKIKFSDDTPTSIYQERMKQACKKWE